MKFQFEICVTSVESAINAEKAGANRIELCDNLYEGGTTPSYGMIKTIKNKLHIDIHILIRPRGGDFVYSEEELEVIKEDVILAKEMSVQGIVVGFLNSDGSVNKEQLKEIVQLAKPMNVTFHRAFDMCNDPFIALEDIVECGCNRLLTSGQQSTALKGFDLIKKLVEKAENRISIMAGSGISKDTIEVLSQTGAKEFHFTAKSFYESKMKFRPEQLSMSSIENMNEYQILFSDRNKIKEIIDLLNKP